MMHDQIHYNGRVSTFDAGRPEAQAIAIADGSIQAVGTDAEIMVKSDGALVPGHQVTITSVVSKTPQETKE